MLTMKDIIREGHPTLRKVAADMALPITDEEKSIAEDMLTFLINSQDPHIADEFELRPGVGIAAPQIDISKRMIAVHVPSEDPEETEPLISTIMINPKIISHSVQQTCLSEGEGCLSVDREIPGYVPRHKRIRVEYTDIEGHKQKKRLKDFAAIVVQHEIDHLNGVMFFDRIDPNNPLALPKGLEILGYEDEAD